MGVFDNHRRPYVLVAYHPYREHRRSNESSHKIVARNLAGDEVEEMAVMVLNDPRDDVAEVYVWSDWEDQWVMGYHRQGGKVEATQMVPLQGPPNKQDATKQAIRRGIHHKIMWRRGKARD